MNEERKIETEEVEGVPPPPEGARRPRRFERKRDYLEGFLSQKPAEAARRPSPAAISTRR